MDNLGDIKSSYAPLCIIVKFTEFWIDSYIDLRYCADAVEVIGPGS